ncbi:hypothetical protein DMC30DRAFT_95896 [Rhodotorula diobovata]|uniref:RlpA-like double-psi beta-barrel-protein domain-containing protein-containing protein n=1 Tax=Rhodotorula diobovata TaxID=5288 RepID=A0A5C5FP40_9BASI|nr:hypothetical protein DMC30DRAFT_95896 [Rhodotorula diobovata]
MQHSPSLSDSEDEKKPASTRSSRSRKGGPSAAEDQPANRMSKKRWLLLGGLGALILVIIIAVVAIYMNSSKSDSSSAGSDAAEDSEPSSHSKSQAVSGSSGLLGASSALSASITGLATSAAGETGATTSAAATVSTQAASSPASTLASAASSGIAAPGAASLADGQPSASSPNLPPGAPTSAAGLLTTAVGSAATGSPAPAAPSVVPPSPSAVGGAVPINSASSEGTGHTRPVPRPAASAQASGGASAGWTGPTQTASSTDAVVKASSTATWFSADQHLSACKMTFADADLIAAISPVMFGSDGSTVSQLCGAELVVWQPDSDQTIMVKIGDVCNECPGATAIDLSQSAFLALAPGGSDDAAAALDAGVLTVQWWFADSAVQQSLPFGFETWAAEGAEASR